MSSGSVCRVCLEGNVKLNSMEIIPLLNLYERLTNTQFNKDERPSAFCPFYYQKLLQCYTFFTTAWRAENLFDQLLLQGVKEFVTKLKLGVTQHITVAPMQSITIDSSTAYSTPNRTIKEEPKPVVEDEPKPVVEDEPKPVVEEELKPAVKEENVMVVKSGAVCRVCLAGNLILNPMESIPLLDTYQKLTNFKFNSEDARPRAVCSFCYQKLLKCYTFSKIACRSEKLFDQLLINGLKEITDELVTKLTLRVKQPMAVIHLQSMTIEATTNYVPLMVTVKEEPIQEEEYTEENRTGNSEDLLLKECTKRALIKQKRPAKFLCAICGKQYDTEIILKRHMKGHTDAQKCTCKVCNKEFLHKYTLSMHMRYHSDNKKFACTVCNKQFRNVHHLQPHMRTHTGEKPFPCTVCQKRFNEKSHLTRHMVLHTVENRERRFSCKQCNKKFHSKQNLNKHILVHTGERPFPCSLCNKRYQTKYSLDIHMKIHNKVLPRLACHLCDKRYHYKTPLLVHLRTHNKRKSKTFQCSVCYEHCTRKKHLITHMRLLHPGQRLYACNDCDKQYDKRYHLIRHMSIHQGKQYSCDLCDTKFIHKYNIVGHMKIHTK